MRISAEVLDVRSVHALGGGGTKAARMSAVYCLMLMSSDQDFCYGNYAVNAPSKHAHPSIRVQACAFPNSYRRRTKQFLFPYTSPLSRLCPAPLRFFRFSSA